MSGPKVDIQWSPVDDDIFITYGTSLHLFQAKERNGSFEVDENGEYFTGNNFSKVESLAFKIK